MEAAKPAMFYNRMEDLKVHCYLCPHNCTINPGRFGVCRARKNIDGDLHSLNYGKISSIALDPIEKKPLYRFKGGSKILSIGTFGCNLKCSFCQNWVIAHDEPKLYDVTSEDIVNKAKELVPKGNIGIAYTYNEPSVWYEFVYDTAVLARKEGLSNVLVTNGFIGKEALLTLLPYIDAMNIDVKAYTASFYKDICGGVLKNVKETVEIAAKKCHVEVTTLIIPTLNDGLEEISQLAKWLSTISKDIPLHLSRYFPNYKVQDIPPTPKETLYKAREEAQKYLDYVYLGNV
ncbi:AmmeMemoRadiSam system radical SAM enzyme [Acetivibrio straminisolvens]|jgi:pyruvate formate lyase activating enzyme|uniref:AmmeMemoRadiSam system radical SAM enzyme n=1 Tax=Acetivibrio straminisolvens TaxID=253314 RepID=UPI00223E9427|nr:AmmeMemoRadiSam system radical SAM enzyme [Acetivibrio straminisolvens]